MQSNALTFLGASRVRRTLTVHPVCENDFSAGALLAGQAKVNRATLAILGLKTFHDLSKMLGDQNVRQGMYTFQCRRRFYKTFPFLQQPTKLYFSSCRNQLRRRQFHRMGFSFSFWS